MSVEPLRVVLVGAGGLGTNTLRALCECPAVRVAGISDQDAAAASAAAAQAGCPAYSDHRRLLAQARPQAAFLAVPPEAAVSLVPLAAEYRAHVWTASPLARNLPEAVALCRLMEQAGLKFAVGTQRRFTSGYNRAKALLNRLGKLYLLQAQYLYDAGPVTSWHADKAAGGGALMEQGSHMFDLVVWLIGLPESVYCLVGTGQRPAGQADQPLYDTDDSAVCLLRYGYKAAATVTVSRCFNPVNESLAAYGDGGSIQAETNRCLLRDRSGAVLDSFADEEPPVKVFQRQVEAFARAAAGEVNRYECSAWESLLTLAVADAAGLSSRTGQPESPADWLAKHGLSAADCLKYSPTPEVRP